MTLWQCAALGFGIVTLFGITAASVVCAIVLGSYGHVAIGILVGFIGLGLFGTTIAYALSNAS